MQCGFELVSGKFMITPKAFGLIIKHFDEVDKVVSLRTVRKRPWLETALTSLLCDLMDEETQSEEKINYTIKQLQSDLDKEDGLFGMNLSLETVEFHPNYERYVSQSDIGLKIIFDNKIEPELSWTRPYLLQAKRLIPKKLNPLYYSETSKFSSIDKDQQKRIELLSKILGASYLKYLLYCPRPENIDEETRMKLSYLRGKTLSTHIFDYTIGLELHKEFLTNGETLKAGIFVTDTSNSNINFGAVHSQLLKMIFPLSWFIAINFTENFDRYERELGINRKADDLVDRILSGDMKKVEELINKIKEVSNDDFPDTIQVLPKHSITLRFSVGEKINSERRFIREQ